MGYLRFLFFCVLLVQEGRVLMLMVDGVKDVKWMVSEVVEQVGFRRITLMTKGAPR